MVRFFGDALKRLLILFLIHELACLFASPGPMLSFDFRLELGSFANSAHPGIVAGRFIDGHGGLSIEEADNENRQLLFPSEN